EWAGDTVPAHLRPRIEVLDEEEKAVSAGRDWTAVRQQLDATMRGRGTDDADERRRGRNAVWLDARQRIERSGLSTWSFSDFPRECAIGEVAGVPVVAFPGLERMEGGTVSLRLFPSPEQSQARTPAAF